MASISRETPFLVMVVSSSLVISSKVKPYWKPEQPPPCTNTRSFSSGLPSSAIRSATLAAALSVKTIGVGISVWMFSATALMGNSWGPAAPGSRWQILLQTAREYRSEVVCRQLQCGLCLGACRKQLAGDGGALVHL